MENETQNKQPGQIGSFLGILIIIALMVIGGLYFWGQHLNQNDYSGVSTTASSTTKTISPTTTQIKNN